MNRTDRTVDAYLEIAKPILALIEPRNSCITQSRITVECFQRLGCLAKPFCTNLVVEAPSANVAYVSGFTDEERERMRSKSASWTEGHPATKVGWRGHVCTIVNHRWFIDSSLDQASAPQHNLVITPDILAIPLDGCFSEDHTIECRIVTPPPEVVELSLHYYPKQDYSFLDSEAWKLTIEIEALCRIICARMRKKMRSA